LTGALELLKCLKLWPESIAHVGAFSKSITPFLAFVTPILEEGGVLLASGRLKRSTERTHRCAEHSKYGTYAMNQIVRFLSAVALTALGGTIAPSIARADFLLTMASGVYQHTDGKTKIVVSSKEGAQGLFIMEGAEISPQEFDLATTPRDGVSHIFVRFEQTSSGPMYSEILLGNRSYKVSGNLTVQLSARTSISIDNNNPYLSVVTEGSDPAKSLSIVGFFGLTEVVRGAGNVALLLAANQLDPSVARIIKPYVVTEGQLVINNKPVTTPTIGTYVKPNSDCLTPQTTVLSNTQIAQLRSTKAEAERVSLFERFVAENKKHSPLKDHLILKADPKSVILLDVRGQNVRQMSMISESVAAKKVCVIADLAV
jgi:hypothetical protein